MSLSFLVKDIQHAWSFLEKRGATMLSEILTDERDGGSYRSFEIADAPRRPELSLHREEGLQGLRAAASTSSGTRIARTSSGSA